MNKGIYHSMKSYNNNCIVYNRGEFNIDLLEEVFGAKKVKKKVYNISFKDLKYGKKDS